MSKTVRDASLVTKRNQYKAVNAYMNDFKAQTMSATNLNQSLKPVGVAGLSAGLVTETRIGCEECKKLGQFLNPLNPQDPNQPLYPTNESRGGGATSTGESGN